MKTNNECSRSKDMDSFERHLSVVHFFIGVSARFSRGEIEFLLVLKEGYWSTRYWCWLPSHSPAQTPSLIPKTLDPRVDERKSPHGWVWLGVFEPPRWLVANWRFKDPQTSTCIVPRVGLYTQKGELPKITTCWKAVRCPTSIASIYVKSPGMTMNFQICLTLSPTSILTSSVFGGSKFLESWIMIHTPEAQWGHRVLLHWNSQIYPNAAGGK